MVSMPILRTATFWIAALVLPGGLLLLAPKAFQVAKRLRTKRQTVQQ